MGLKKLLYTLGIVALLISCSNAKEPDSSPTNLETTQSPSLVESDANNILKTGNFVPGDHPTQGKFSLLSSGDKTFLELDQSFKTDNGPDLFLLLHQESNPKSYSPESFELVSQLKSTSGQQQYEIPNGIDIKKYQSIVIWCKKFNVTFGYAPFKNQDTQE